MKKIFHVLIGLGLLVFYVGALIFVFGQAICLLLGQPAMVTAIETNLEALIFPAIAGVGVLSWLYGLIWNKKKASE